MGSAYRVPYFALIFCRSICRALVHILRKAFLALLVADGLYLGVNTRMSKYTALIARHSAGAGVPSRGDRHITCAHCGSAFLPRASALGVLIKVAIAINRANHLTQIDRWDMLIVSSPGCMYYLIS